MDEISAFQRSFSCLQEGLKHELVYIASKLFTESLISSENRDECMSRIEPPNERAAHLLSVLESKIRVDPASFHSIVQVLDSCPTLQTLAAKLRSELERVERSGREHQQGPPTEEHEMSAEEVHGTSASLTAGSLTQSACVSLCVQQQIHFLEDKFQKLVEKLICMLSILESESDTFIHEVRAVILALPLSLKKQHNSFLECHRKDFIQASTAIEILEILCSYWDYLNVSLFEHVVTRFGADEMKTEFKEYLEHLKRFRQETKLGDFIDALALGGDRTALPPEFVEVQMTLGSSWDNCTLEDAEQLRLRQCRKAEIASYGLYITDGRRKCIVLTWGVAEMAVSSLLSVLDSTEQRECDILAIDCNAAADKFFKVGEIRPAEDSDFRYFTALADSDDGWTKNYDSKDLSVFNRDAGANMVKIYKARGEFKDITAATTFDVLMDGEFRKKWDALFIEDYEIGRLDDNNDIGYYSMRLPGPLKNRDFVNQRSWRVRGDEYILFNHTVHYDEIPPKKEFVRGVSYMTGWVIRANGPGCKMIYITQSDPKGKVPRWLYNFGVSQLVPQILSKIYKAAVKYEEWKLQHNPDFKPWLYPEQNTLPLLDLVRTQNLFSAGILIEVETSKQEDEILKKFEDERGSEASLEYELKRFLSLFH